MTCQFKCNARSDQMLKKIASFLLITFLFIISAGYAMTDQETYELGIKAYIYAYPMVLMDVTKQNSSVPINQFAHMAEFPNANFKQIVRPNADTLYSSAWLDLSAEPIILSVPNTKGRYYLMPMLSAWTDVFASPGKRTTGTDAANFAITGPFWQGSLPSGIKQIKAPTNMVWILGRVQTNGKSDYDFVHQIQKNLKLISLSKWNKNYTPPIHFIVNKNIDNNIPPVVQVAKMDATTFFNRFTALLKNNPPQPQDQEQVKLLGKMGIRPGEIFDSSHLSSKQIDRLNRAILIAQQQISDNVKKTGVRKQGWNLMLIGGHYGNHYLERASIAYAGLGANLPQDAIYLTAFVDNNNQPLTGKYNYVLHFNGEKLPPVNAFWSLSIYGKDSFFIANPIDRYAIGDRDKLQFNKNGSLDIYIQHDSPGKDKESNWLPVPTGEFNVMLRMYWPKEIALNEKWNTPGIQRTKE